MHLVLQWWSESQNPAKSDMEQKVGVGSMQRSVPLTLLHTVSPKPLDYATSLNCSLISLQCAPHFSLYPIFLNCTATLLYMCPHTLALNPSFLHNALPLLYCALHYP